MGCWSMAYWLLDPGNVMGSNLKHLYYILKVWQLWLKLPLDPLMYPVSVVVSL